jgi:hypothetical protein
MNNETVTLRKPNYKIKSPAHICTDYRHYSGRGETAGDATNEGAMQRGLKRRK